MWKFSKFISEKSFKWIPFCNFTVDLWYNESMTKINGHWPGLIKVAQESKKANQSSEKKYKFNGVKKLKE